MGWAWITRKEFMTYKKKEAGERIRAEGGGRKPKPEAAKAVKVHITLAPDLYRLVVGHAVARGEYIKGQPNISASINALLAEALRNHEVDHETEEVY